LDTISVGGEQHQALPMIVVLEQHNAHKHQHLIDEMFRLRARIFRDRLNWDVEVTDGKERDRYDDEQPAPIQSRLPSRLRGCERRPRFSAHRAMTIQGVKQTAVDSLF
jgi:hypothetical protein